MSFSESLPRWLFALIWGRNSAGVQLLTHLRPAAAAPAPGSSMALWLWVGVVLAVVVIGGYVLSSRR